MVRENENEEKTVTLAHAHTEREEESTFRTVLLPEMRTNGLQAHTRSLSFNYLSAKIGLLLRSRDLSASPLILVALAIFQVASLAQSLSLSRSLASASTAESTTGCSCNQPSCHQQQLQLQQAQTN